MTMQNPTPENENAPASRTNKAVVCDALVRRVWFTMVLVPTKGWTRVGKAYGSEKSARGCLHFVSQAWHGLRTKTAQCTLRWKDGVMDERSRKTLSEKFNMEPPDACLGDLVSKNMFLPDYLYSLDAMHEAEKVLTEEQWDRYENHLRIICDACNWSYGHAGKELLHATAAQRAEAFLKTIGKWEDDK